MAPAGEGDLAHDVHEPSGEGAVVLPFTQVVVYRPWRWRLALEGQ